MATVSFEGDVNFGTPVRARRSRRWGIAVVAALATFGGWWVFGGGKSAVDRGAVASAVVERSTSVEDALRGGAALDRCRQFLLDAQAKLDSIPGMTAVFHKQERIEGVLSPLHVMELKCRNEPFSVYMKWREPDEGQEVIWTRGANDGKIIVCPPGWKRKVMRMVKIDPDSDQAMAASRRPISSSGIWMFVARVRETVEQELMRDPTVQVVQTSGAEISGRACERYTFERSAAPAPGEFQRMVLYADQQLGVPVALEHYRWGTADGKLVAQLEESFLFQDLNLGAELDDSHFDETNPAYEFVKK